MPGQIWYYARVRFVHKKQVQFEKALLLYTPISKAVIRRYLYQVMSYLYHTMRIIQYHMLYRFQIVLAPLPHARPGGEPCIIQTCTKCQVHKVALYVNTVGILRRRNTRPPPSNTSHSTQIRDLLYIYIYIYYIYISALRDLDHELWESIIWTRCAIFPPEGPKGQTATKPAENIIPSGTPIWASKAADISG